jgi:hypothetical protein
VNDERTNDARTNERTNDARTNERTNDARTNERTTNNEREPDTNNDDEREDNMDIDDVMNIDDEIIPVNVTDERPASTRRSQRVTAKPFRHDPAHYGLVVLDEPLTYKQAMMSPDRDKWKGAINDELGAHEKNKTWIIVPMTNDMNIIGSKWVFKIKRDADGNIVKYKARLVAKGFNQQQGIDYQETFAPVLKYKSIRIIIVLSLHFNLRIKQFDVKTAFLNAKVKEDIYVEVPDGMDVADGHVLKLQQALYGIKQAPREWHAEIDGYIRSLGYIPCVKDTCLYWKKTRTNAFILVGLFVDDIAAAFARNDENEWLNDERLLKSKYELSDLGDMQHILGMRVTRDRQGVTIDQETYLRDKLTLFGFDACKSQQSPAVKAVISENAELLSEQDHRTYQAMVGSLIYASYSTRPDITFATNMVARYMSKPSSDNMIMAKRVLRYLHGTSSHGLHYTSHNQHQGGEIVLTGYCDADWGGDLTDRKSTTGYCTFINGNLIDWQSKKQSTVALSSTEAEYMAISEVTKEIMWLRSILAELHISVVTPTVIYVDNQSAIKISENDISHARTKHIDIRHHFIRDTINSGVIKLQWISTNDQLADIFTKALPIPRYTSIRDRLVSKRATVINNGRRL